MKIKKPTMLDTTRIMCGTFSTYSRALHMRHIEKIGDYFWILSSQILHWSLKLRPYFLCVWIGSQILKFCRSQIYEKPRSQIFMFKFDTGSLFFVCLNTGSQILNFQRNQIYWKNWGAKKLHFIVKMRSLFFSFSKKRKEELNNFLTKNSWSQLINY